jgi:hypothetical protein
MRLCLAVCTMLARQQLLQPQDRSGISRRPIAMATRQAADDGAPSYDGSGALGFRWVCRKLSPSNGMADGNDTPSAIFCKSSVR